MAAELINWNKGGGWPKVISVLPFFKEMPKSFYRLSFLDILDHTLPGPGVVLLHVGARQYSKSFLLEPSSLLVKKYFSTDAGYLHISKK